MIIRTVGELKKLLEGVPDDTPINYEDAEYMMDAEYIKDSTSFGYTWPHGMLDISGTDADEYGRA